MTMAMTQIFATAKCEGTTIFTFHTKKSNRHLQTRVIFTWTLKLSPLLSSNEAINRPSSALLYMPLELYSRLFKLPTPPNHEWWWWKEAKKKFSLREWMRKFLNIFATLARKMRWRRRWSDGKLNGKKIKTAESWLTLMEIILLRVQKKRDRRIIWKVIKFDLRVLCAGIIPTLSMAFELCGSWREFDFFSQTFRTTLSLHNLHRWLGGWRSWAGKLR